MKNIVYIAASLDGFIADSEGSIDWLNEYQEDSISGEDLGWKKFMDRVDAIIMGKNTYQSVLNMGPWPYLKKVFVLSNSMKLIDTSLEGKIEIIRGDLKTNLEVLSKQGYNNLYIDGGQTIQNFLKENLIDEIILTRVPILLGGGSSLFGSLEHFLCWKHIETKSFKSGLVQSHYKK